MNTYYYLYGIYNRENTAAVLLDRIADSECSNFPLSIQYETNRIVVTLSPICDRNSLWGQGVTVNVTCLLQFSMGLIVLSRSVNNQKIIVFTEIGLVIILIGLLSKAFSIIFKNNSYV